MKQPEHLAGPAFQKAADKIAFLENQLSDEQQPQYAAFVEQQKKEREEQDRKAAQKKAEYDQAKEKHAHPALNLEPPANIKNPYLRKMALDAQAEHNKATALQQTQLDDKLRFLEKLEQQRAKRQQEKLGQFREEAQRMTQERASPEFKHAASPEQQVKPRQDFSRAAVEGKAKTDFQKASKDNALARAFAKAAEKEQGQERDRGHDDQGRSRERGE